MEAGDLRELGSIRRLYLGCALCAWIKHGSMIDAIKLLRQYVGLDENRSIKMGLREAKDMCEGLKAEMNAARPPSWWGFALAQPYRVLALSIRVRLLKELRPDSP